MPLARLTRDFRHRPGLTRFLPARLSADGGRSDAGGLARVGRRSGAHARQRVPGGRPRPRRSIRAGELIRVLLEMKKLSHYDSGGTAAHGGCLRQSRRRGARRARTPSCASARRCWRSCRRIPRAIRWRSRASPGIAGGEADGRADPACHPLPLSHADVEVTVETEGVRIVATASTTAQTGCRDGGADGGRRWPRSRFTT